jgi:hypothetical protein
MKKLLLLILCSGCTYWATSQNLPRIIVLATGGTIAGQQPNTDRAGYVPGKIKIEELLKDLPSIFLGVKKAALFEKDNFVPDSKYNKADSALDLQFGEKIIPVAVNGMNAQLHFTGDFLVA